VGKIILGIALPPHKNGDKTMTTNERSYTRLYRRFVVGNGDHFGADWKTLKISHPQVTAEMQRLLVKIEEDRR